MTTAEIRAILDPDVQPERFRGDQTVLWHQALHVTVVLVLSVATARWIDALPLYAVIPLALIAGHSVCMSAFAAHEISHGAASFPARWMRRVVEKIGWTFGLFTSPKLQRRAHNNMHHKYTNMPADPDRRLHVEEYAERPPVLAKISPFIFPNGSHPVLTGLYGWGLAVMMYHNAILWSTLLQTGRTHDMRLDAVGRRQVALEVASNFVVYGVLFAASGFAPAMLLFLGLMYFSGAWIAGLYIATNHLLAGHHDTVNDPLANSISLRMPKWIDVLHLRFSHHVEHHLYPTLPSTAYPAIRAALRRHFPDHYREMTLPQAVGELLSRPFVMLDDSHQVYPGGEGPGVPVLFRNEPVPPPATA